MLSTLPCPPALWERESVLAEVEPTLLWARVLAHKGSGHLRCPGDSGRGHQE